MSTIVLIYIRSNYFFQDEKLGDTTEIKNLILLSLAKEGGLNHPPISPIFTPFFLQPFFSLPKKKNSHIN